MKHLLLCGLFLMPPTLTEIHENGRVEFVIPDGYNNHIRVSVPAGMEDEGRAEATELLHIIHLEHEYHFMTGGIEVGIKAHSYAEAVENVGKWMKIIGGSA